MDGLKYLFLEDRDQPFPSWLAELEDVLECPVCLKTFLDPPIHQCENGHCFCNSCHEPLQKEGKDCPVCRGRLTNARSLAFEKLLEKLPKIKCRYEDCQFKRADVDVVYQHEIGCLFRLVECGNCQDSIPMSKLYDHLSTDHNLPSLDRLDQVFGTDVELKVGLDYSGQVGLIYNNLTFFVNFLSTQGSMQMFWISFCGGEKEAEEYEYTIKIVSSAGKKAGRAFYLFTGTRECVSCEVSHEDMKKKKEALLINKTLLEKAVKDPKKNRFNIKIMITKL